MLLTALTPLAAHGRPASAPAQHARWRPWRSVLAAAAAWSLCAAAPAQAQQQAWDHAFYSGNCQAHQGALELQRSLYLVHLQLLAQGLQLRVMGCPRVPELPSHVVLVLVGVWVSNAELAAGSVRGPLAEGEMLDMGGQHYRWAGQSMRPVVRVDEDDVSPDVQFNRQWLARTMQARGFEPVPGRWWTFAWSGHGL